jgi:hypothetical protein
MLYSGDCASAAAPAAYGLSGVACYDVAWRLAEIRYDMSIDLWRHGSVLRAMVEPDVILSVVACPLP